LLHYNDYITRVSYDTHIYYIYYYIFMTIERITFENLNEHLLSDVEVDDMYYYVDKQIRGNWIPTIGFKENKIVTYTNDWLYLIKHNPSKNPRVIIADTHNRIYSNILRGEIPITNIDEPVVNNITSFAPGTVHGFVGFFELIMNYIKVYAATEHKLLIYKESNKGMLDIVNHLCNKGILDKSKIIYIQPNYVYKFKKIITPRLANHIYRVDTPFMDTCNNFVATSIIDNTTLEQYKQDNVNTHVCTMKTTGSNNIVKQHGFTQECVDKFCDKNNISFLNPGITNEIEVIHKIYNCEVLYASFGTSFMKNFVYISDKCRKIVVYILKGSHYERQYEHCVYNNQSTKFRNAKLEFVIVTHDDIFNLHVDKDT